MWTKLLEKYIEERKESDEKFREDFEEGFEKFKNDPNMYKTVAEDIRLMYGKLGEITDLENTVYCSSCGLPYSKEEIDNKTGECFYCKVFLEHDLKNK